MSKANPKPIFRVLAIFNGKYDINLFTVPKIMFAELFGNKADEKNLKKFLEKT